MALFITPMMFVALVAPSPTTAAVESIDGRVVQVVLPIDDVTLSYVETKGGMSVELKTSTASVMGTKFFVGDGVVAVELVAHPLNGIFFQGATKLTSGFKFEKYSVVEVLPGYRRASELGPGDVYITLPAVTFKTPPKTP